MSRAGLPPDENAVDGMVEADEDEEQASLCPVRWVPHASTVIGVYMGSATILNLFMGPMKARKLYTSKMVMNNNYYHVVTFPGFNFILL